MNLFLTFACLTQAVFVFGQQVGNARTRVQFPSDEDSSEVSRPVFPGDSSPDHSNRCQTSDRRPGRCVLFDTCPQFMTPTPDFDALRRHLCGFSGHVPRVCCPEQQVTRSLEPDAAVMPNDTQSAMSVPSSRPQLLPEDCGHTKASYLRIVDGEEAEPGAWPWLAALFIEERGVLSAECGAALISTRYVVTAAHCVTGSTGNLLTPRQLTVRLGDHNLFQTDDGASAVDIAVSSVTRHPQFQLRTFLNDIALLRLQDPAVLNDFVQPVCLSYDPPTRTEDLQGKSAFVAGWGTTSFDGPSSPVVRQVRLPVWNETACRHAYRNDVNLTSAYMCAGYPDGGKDACQGDSGGPLVLPVNTVESRFHLIGIVSFGKRCAQVGFPGVYTNVREFLPWISDNIH